MRGRKWKELMCLSVLLLLAMTPVVSRADVSYGRYPDGTDNWPSHSITSLGNANDFYK